LTVTVSARGSTARAFAKALRACTSPAASFPKIPGDLKVPSFEIVPLLNVEIVPRLFSATTKARLNGPESEI
jgi:hypothetical protein